MVTQRNFSNIVVGTTVVIAMQLLSAFTPRPAQALETSRNLQLSPEISANLSSRTQLPTPEVELKSQSFLISQNTRSRISFTPPIHKKSKSSRGAGSRGCADEFLQEDLVTLLIHSDRAAGQTISEHPSFFWYLSQPVKVPMRFALVEPGVAEPVFTTEIEPPPEGMPAGIVQLELPQDKPELVPGKLYKWSVTLVCDAYKESANPFYYSWIERIATPPELEQQPASLAQAGLWPDTLAAILAEQQANPQELSWREELFSLLTQVGLTEVVEQERQRLELPPQIEQIGETATD
ncbi:MAG: DUF928 domain-containing protein [Symploca sp. SIO1A3]|nr:DUF928 domain-containing protein [Symploca sp. SIO1A3]